MRYTAPQSAPDAHATLRSIQTDSAKAAPGGRVRFAALFLRSRLVWASLASLVAVALACWIGVRLSAGPPGNGGAPDSSSLVLFPLGAACVIAAGARSPFGDAENTSARTLPLVRLLNLALLMLCGALAIIAAAALWEVEPTAWLFMRNLIGFAGLALLSGRALGAGLSWGPPLVYGIAVLLWGANYDDAWWTWCLHPADEAPAATLALALLSAGLAAACLSRTRDSSEEGE